MKRVYTWACDSHVLRVCASVDPEGPGAVHQNLLLSSTAKTSEKDWSIASCVVRCGHRREGDMAKRICKGEISLRS